VTHIRTNIVPVALVAWAVIGLSGCTDHLDKGNTCLQLGDYQMAVAFFEQELRARPGSYEGRLGIGKAYLQRAIDRPGDGEAWHRALTNLEAARTISPKERIDELLSQAWSARARSLLTEEDTVEALGALSRAIEYTPDNIEPINLAGIVYFRIGDRAKAEMLFERAASLDSTHASAEFNLGMVHWQEGDIAAAREHWLTALKRSPEDGDILYWFARAEKSIREKGTAR
jgi:tetratricopeptide (TPR) repeat protein